MDHRCDRGFGGVLQVRLYLMVECAEDEDVADDNSPLPANIYFPAIPTLARAFHESIDTINQTVTVYLIFQGLSPMLWGPISDRYGRRLVYRVCLSILRHGVMSDRSVLATLVPAVFPIWRQRKHDRSWCWRYWRHLNE
jgi:MFS family permease